MLSTQRAIVVALVVAGLTPATSAARMNAASQPSPCAKTFTIGMFRAAAITAYRGTRTPNRRELAHLRRFLRCARHPWTRPVDRRIWARSRQMNAARKTAAAGPTNYGLASWYDDSGGHCCGYYATYGVAVCGSAGPCFPMGTKIEFFYGGRTVVATVDDHGPYVGGRNFDLNQNTAGALGFGGVGTVGWRIVS